MRSREEVKAARKAFAREYDGRLRDLPAKHVGELCATATARAATVAEELIANSSIDGGVRFSLPRDPDHPLFEQLVHLYVLSTPGFREWLTDRAEEISSAFVSKMTTAEYAERLAAFDAELAEIDAAGERDAILARRAEIDAELAALDQG